MHGNICSLPAFFASFSFSYLTQKIGDVLFLFFHFFNRSLNKHQHQYQHHNTFPNQYISVILTTLSWFPLPPSLSQLSISKRISRKRCRLKCKFELIMSLLMQHDTFLCARCVLFWPNEIYSHLLCSRSELLCWAPDLIWIHQTMEDAKFANTKKFEVGKKPKWITVNRLNTFYGGPFFIVPLTSVKPIYVIDLEMLRVWHIL